MENINTYPDGSGSIMQPDAEISSEHPLLVDSEGKSYLNAAAKWALFIAIVGFVMTAFLFLLGVGFILITSSMSEYRDFQSFQYLPMSMAWFGVVYVVSAVLYFFPYYFLFCFAKETRSALANNGQESLNMGLKNIKRTFKFIGIVVIISLVFLLLAVPAIIFSLGMIQALTGGIAV